MISASASAQQAEQEQQIANYNAARDYEQASYAQAKGSIDSYNEQRKGEQAAAQARAAQAESGLSTTEGSPLLLQQKFASETAWHENLAMSDATNQQNNLTNKANIESYEGKVRADAARMQGTASLLSGFAGAAKAIGGSFG
jgi:hypothetical protein